MLEPNELLQSPPNSQALILANIPEEEFRAFIENLNPHHKVIVAISPDQDYHKGPRLKAILKALRDKSAQVVIAVGDELKRFNFQVERNQDSANSDIVKNLVNELETTWPTLHLNFDAETTAICEEMKNQNKLEVLSWRECKTRFAASYQKSSTILKEIFDDPTSDFRRIVLEAASQFFHRAIHEKYAKNDTVQLCLKTRGADWILAKYIQYVFEECCMFGAWQLEGFTQMAYPFNFYSQNNTNSPLFNCVMSVITQLKNDDTPLMRLLDITFEKNSPQKKSKPGARKGSLDSSLAEKQQEKNHISELKQKIRRLQEEIQQLSRQTNQVIHLFTKYHPKEELPSNVSIVLAKRKPPTYPNDELNMSAFTLVAEEFERDMLTIDLSEITLRAQRLEHEVAQLNSHNTSLKNILQRLENETLPLKEEEIRGLEENVEELEDTLSYFRTIMENQTVIIFKQLIELQKLYENGLPAKDEIIKRLTTLSLEGREQAIRIIAILRREVITLHTKIAHQHTVNENLTDEIALLKNINRLISLEKEKAEADAAASSANEKRLQAENLALQQKLKMLELEARAHGALAQEAQAVTCSLRADLKEARETIDERTAELTVAHEALADIVDEKRFRDQEARLALEAYTDIVEEARTRSLAMPAPRKHLPFSTQLLSSHTNFPMFCPPKKQNVSDPGTLHLGEREARTMTGRRSVDTTTLGNK